MRTRGSEKRVFSFKQQIRVRRRIFITLKQILNKTTSTFIILKQFLHVYFHHLLALLLTHPHYVATTSLLTFFHTNACGQVYIKLVHFLLFLDSRRQSLFSNLTDWITRKISPWRNKYQECIYDIQYIIMNMTA